jgi:thermitase
MKRVLRFLVLAVLLAGMFGGNTAQAAAASPRDTVLVKFRAGVSQAEKGSLHRQQGAAVRGIISGIDVEVVTVPAGRAESAAASYAKDSRVRYAEVDHEASAVGGVNDYYFVNGYQWALTTIQAPQAWDLTTGCSTISIAVLDTGVDTSHPDLSGKVVGNINYSSSGTVGDVYGHGTHVAGIAAAATNNGQGVAGVGYDSTILNVKVMGDDGVGTYSAVAYGIVWAADHGARVINMSLGGTSSSSTLEDAVNYAWGKGVVLVAAAGNNGNGVPFYPAYFQNVIAVASTGPTDSLSPYSDRGDWVDVAAPGGSIWSTKPNNSYGSMSGTSMASPHVAGLAALVFTRVSDINGNGFLNDEVRACIQNNADNIGVTGIGSGRINAYKAVQATSPAPPTTGSITGTVRDAATGAAIAGATVTDGARSATSNTNGGYSIANVPVGTYTVTATATGYNSASQSVQVTAGQTSTANLALSPLPGAIAGTVRDAATGATIAGATVKVGVASTTTDASGKYILSGLTEGSYTETVSASGYADVSQSVSVLTGQTTVANVNLPPNTMWVDSISFKQSGGNLRIDVKVVNARGAMSGVKITVYVSGPVGKTWTLSGTTSSNGIASLMVQKASRGTYLVTVTGVYAGVNYWDKTKGVNSASYTAK